MEGKWNVRKKREGGGVAVGGVEGCGTRWFRNGRRNFGSSLVVIEARERIVVVNER